MELTVEAGHVVCRWQGTDAKLDNTQTVCIVKRSQVVQVLEVFVGFIGYQLRLAVVAAMDDSMADDANVFLALDLREVLIFDQSFQQKGEGIALALYVIVHLLGLDDRLPISDILEGGGW